MYKNQQQNKNKKIERKRKGYFRLCYTPEQIKAIHMYGWMYFGQLTFMFLQKGLQ